MDTIYLANLKASKQFGNKMLKGALCITDFLEALEQEDVQELIFEYEGKKFLNIDVVERKKANFGKTHYIKINDFVPDSSSQETAPHLKLVTSPLPKTMRRWRKRQESKRTRLQSRSYCSLEHL